mmetsp:Transcript_23946/g.69138  ORF Transcript_23946/g.69138 Transcript_23946/m.69138 type:complete len:148 (-) Transcript_23946:440-883(-)
MRPACHEQPTRCRPLTISPATKLDDKDKADVDERRLELGEGPTVECRDEAWDLMPARELRCVLAEEAGAASLPARRWSCRWNLPMPLLKEDKKELMLLTLAILNMTESVGIPGCHVVKNSTCSVSAASHEFSGQPCAHGARPCSKAT